MRPTSASTPAVITPLRVLPISAGHTSQSLTSLQSSLPLLKISGLPSHGASGRSVLLSSSHVQLPSHRNHSGSYHGVKAAIARAADTSIDRVRGRAGVSRLCYRSSSLDHSSLVSPSTKVATRPHAALHPAQARGCLSPITPALESDIVACSALEISPSKSPVQSTPLTFPPSASTHNVVGGKIAPREQPANIAASTCSTPRWPSARHAARSGLT